MSISDSPHMRPNATTAATTHAQRFTVAVQHADFDLNTQHALLINGDRGVGAVVSFIGMVRDLNLSEDVVALELEHYPGMTEKTLTKIIDQARARWSLQAARIVHRVGKMYPGDQIVLVLTASAHRGDAYEANTFIMDFLKTEAPFWKKEWTPEGPRWIEARTSDDNATAKWSKP